MPLPSVTNLQFLILSCLVGGEKSGRELRATLRQEEGKKRERSAPSFYMLMARMEEAELVEGRYERKEVEGYEVKERVYKVTKGGEAAFNQFREFAIGHGNPDTEIATVSGTTRG
jgi:DNA-binding PadR family transcriptional regulator